MASFLSPKSKSYKKFDDEDDDSKNTGLVYLGDDTSIQYSVHYQQLQDDGVNLKNDTTVSEFPVLEIPQDIPIEQSLEIVNAYIGKGTSKGDAFGQKSLQGSNSYAIAVITKVKTGKLPPVTPPSKDYLYCSIFVALFCCPVLGIFAIHKALQGRRAAANGYKARSTIATRTSYRLARLGFIIGVLLQIILIFALVEAFA